MRISYKNLKRYKEIAHVLNKTDASVKVLIHRARKALEKIVIEEGYKYEN